MARFRSLALLIFICLLPAAALAGSSAAERKAARSFVEGKQQQLTAAVKAGQDAKIEKIFKAMFDYDYLAKESLGTHWAECTDAQRKEFTQLLQTLVRRAYRKNVDKTLDYAITYHGVVDGKRGVLVKTRARNKKDAREEELSIDYVVARSGSTLRVHDVVTEGSSLVTNYRKSFSRVVRKHGIDGLLKRMRKRAAGKK